MTADHILAAVRAYQQEERMSGDKLIKFAPRHRKMLERIEERSGQILEMQITSSGGAAYTTLNVLRRLGYVVRVEHPTVKSGGYPADALAITDAGRQRLQQEKK